jgi:hypothetical protein
MIDEQKIKEIADDLDCGHLVFLHKTTGRVISYPEEMDIYDDDDNPWSEEMTEIEDNYIDYHRIENWTSRESFAVMEDFANKVTNLPLQNKLWTVLSGKKPFANFKMVIDHSGEYRQQWFDFKNAWQQEYVRQQLEEL